MPYVTGGAGCAATQYIVAKSHQHRAVDQRSAGILKVKVELHWWNMVRFWAITASLCEEFCSGMDSFHSGESHGLLSRFSMIIEHIRPLSLCGPWTRHSGCPFRLDRARRVYGISCAFNNDSDTTEAFGVSRERYPAQGSSGNFLGINETKSVPRFRSHTGMCLSWITLVVLIY